MAFKKNYVFYLVEYMTDYDKNNGKLDNIFIQTHINYMQNYLFISNISFKPGSMRKSCLQKCKKGSRVLRSFADNLSVQTEGSFGA